MSIDTIEYLNFLQLMKIIEIIQRSLHRMQICFIFFISLINTIVSYFPYEVNKWREGSVNVKWFVYIRRIFVYYCICRNMTRHGLPQKLIQNGPVLFCIQMKSHTLSCTRCWSKLFLNMYSQQIVNTPPLFEYGINFNYKVGEIR